MTSGHEPKGFLEEMGVAIHDLCQPLTTLRCRMELAVLQAGADGLGGDEFRTVMEDALSDVRRSFASVDLMRQLLLAEMKLRS